MTITKKRELSSAPHFVSGTFSAVASAAQTAAVPTAGFDKLVYMTATAPASQQVSVRAVMSGTEVTITPSAGISRHVTAADRVGYVIGVLPGEIKFSNDSSGALTIHYELHKSPTHDRGR